MVSQRKAGAFRALRQRLIFPGFSAYQVESMQRFASSDASLATLGASKIPREKEASMNVSPAFQAFAQEAPQHQQAWSEAVQALGAASALDDKTAALAYLAVMAGGPPAPALRVYLDKNA